MSYLVNPKIVFIIGVLISLIFNQVRTFDLSSIPCSSSFKQQSPIDISTSNTIFREEKYFRILSQNFTNFNSTWKVFPEEKTIGFSGDIGSLILVKDWAMYKFLLKSIYFRYGPSHRINGQKFDLEMEVNLDLDETYRTPGRYIHPTAEKLTLSYFFVSLEEGREDEKYSLLFNYTNLRDFYNSPTSNNVFFTRKIKFNEIFQQQPGYFYEGSTTSGNCETVWRIIMTKYQLIPKEQYDQIRSILNSYGYLTKTQGIESNSRTVQQVNPATIVYRSDSSSERLLIEATRNQYITSKYVSYTYLSLIAILLLLFSS